MELKTTTVKVRSSHSEVVVLPLGDAQYTGKDGSTARTLLRDHVQRGLDEGAWFLGMGDYTDFASPSNRARLKAANLYDTANRVIDDAAHNLVQELYEDLLKPTKGRWLGLLQGHHFHQYETGLTTDIELCELLGAPFLGTCFAPATRILTADMRWVPIGEIEIGAALMAFDEHGPHRCWRKTTVQHVERHVAELWEIRLSNGTTILTTADHPFLAQRRGTKGVGSWYTPQQLRSCLKKQLSQVIPPWESDNSWEGGWLAGFFDGEGSVCEPPRKGCLGGRYLISAAQALGPLWDEVKAALLRRQFRFTTRPMRQDKPHHKLRESLSLLGGKVESMRFMGTLRPVRLMGRFSIEGSLMNRHASIAITSIRPTGVLAEVVNLQTSSRTFVAEGFPVHNCAYVRVLVEICGSMRIPFTLWCHHGVGSGLSVGSPLLKLERLANNWDADVFLIGHQSKLVSAPIERVYPVWSGTGDSILRHRKILLACTGSFSRGYIPGARQGRIAQGDYVEQKMLTPSHLGGIVLRLKFKREWKGKSPNVRTDLSVEL